MTAELVILIPLVVMFALVAVGLGRFQSARQDIADVARAGAQAAAVAVSPDEAAHAAAATVADEIDGQGRMCSQPSLVTDVSDFVPGGVVRVTVTCQVDLSDLLVPGLPGSATLRVTQVAPIDPYRSVQ